MSQNSVPQYAKVEQPFGPELQFVHCPICGTATISDTEQGFQTNPCLHLAFIFVGAIGEFEFTSPDFEQRASSKKVIEWLEKLDQADEFLGFDNFKDYLQLVGYDNQLLAIELTYGGMACGPVWQTDIYGFDYGQIR